MPLCVLVGRWLMPIERDRSRSASADVVLRTSKNVVAYVGIKRSRATAEGKRPVLTPSSASSSSRPTLAPSSASRSSRRDRSPLPAQPSAPRKLARAPTPDPVRPAEAIFSLGQVQSLRATVRCGVLQAIINCKNKKSADKSDAALLAVDRAFAEFSTEVLCTNVPAMSPTRSSKPAVGRGSVGGHPPSTHV